MNPETTALLLIGFQNDYFAKDGVLYGVVEESNRVTGTLANTLALIEALAPTAVTMISTPILFTPDYRELKEPVGILATIKEVQAFKEGTDGAKTIEQLRAFGNRVIEVPGKRGLNAFSNTKLDSVLRERGVDTIILAGTVTSICIDSTGRSAFEKGYNVSVLSDCTSSRTTFEQEFFCDQIFPLYASVITSKSLLDSLLIT
ncbi:MAG: cysteine hydrolase [Kofleriaceae bacterium]|nr:cysteine hydrolase [Kofleriaceae bacterium]